MFVYNIIDESYMCFNYSSVKGVIDFSKSGTYFTRDGIKIDAKFIKNALKLNSTLYLYEMDDYDEVKNDWTYVIYKDNIIKS